MTQTVLTMCVTHTLLCLEYIGTKLGTIYSQMNPNKLPKITGSVPPPKTLLTLQQLLPMILKIYLTSFRFFKSVNI